MSGIINSAGSKSGVIGFNSIEIFTDASTIITLQSGVTVSDGDRFRMWKQSGIVYINVVFFSAITANNNSQYIHCGNLTAASGLRPTADREIYGGVTGFDGDSAHSFQIESDGKLEFRHVETADTNGYMGINGWYII